jgi:hypothetical protein
MSEGERFEPPTPVRIRAIALKGERTGRRVGGGHSEELQPKFVGEREQGAEGTEGTAYEPDKQIHAPWLLWRTHDVMDEATRSAVRTMYAHAGYDLSEWVEE